MLKVNIPNKITVYKLVENFENNPQCFFKIVQTLVINILFTGFKQRGVNI